MGECDEIGAPAGAKPGQVRSYGDLVVWQRAMELVASCYRISDGFPRSEEFGLRSQLRKAAVSVPANIAEGHGRGTTREYIRSLNVAHGSLMELETHLQIAERLKYLAPDVLGPVLERCREIGRMINALSVRLKSRLDARK